MLVAPQLLLDDVRDAVGDGRPTAHAAPLLLEVQVDARRAGGKAGEANVVVARRRCLGGHLAIVPLGRPRRQVEPTTLGRRNAGARTDVVPS